MKEKGLRIDLIKDPLVRRALEGSAMTFSPEDPGPDSGRGSRILVDRMPKTSVKLGDAAFHPAFSASNRIVVAGNTSVMGRTTRIDNLTREDMR